MNALTAYDRQRLDHYNTTRRAMLRAALALYNAMPAFDSAYFPLDQYPPTAPIVQRHLTNLLHYNALAHTLNALVWDMSASGAIRTQHDALAVPRHYRIYKTPLRTMLAHRRAQHYR